MAPRGRRVGFLERLQEILVRSLALDAARQLAVGENAQGDERVAIAQDTVVYRGTLPHRAGAGGD